MTSSNNDKNDHSSLQLVPETLLKRRHDLDDLKRRRDAAPKQRNRKVFSKSQKAKQVYVKKPETFLAQATSRKNQDRRFKRVLRKGMQKRASNKVVYKEKELMNDNDDDENVEKAKSTTVVRIQSNSVNAPMVFCVRMRDNVGMSRKTRNVLIHKLGLRDVNEGVVLAYTEEMKRCLHLVEPWVLYGPISSSVMTDLITRRGHGRVVVGDSTSVSQSKVVTEKDVDMDDDEEAPQKVKPKKAARVPLSDNTIIENALGQQYNIICVEDLVHELCRGKDSKVFEPAASFLWPFRLRPPRSREEEQDYNQRLKVYGDVGHEMEDYLRIML